MPTTKAKRSDKLPSSAPPQFDILAWCDHFVGSACIAIGILFFTNFLRGLSLSPQEGQWFQLLSFAFIGWTIILIVLGVYTIRWAFALNKSTSRSALRSGLIRLMCINGLGALVAAGNARYAQGFWIVAFVVLLAICMVNFSCLVWLQRQN